MKHILCPAHFFHAHVFLWSFNKMEWTLYTCAERIFCNLLNKKNDIRFEISTVLMLRIQDMCVVLSGRIMHSFLFEQRCRFYRQCSSSPTRSVMFQMVQSHVTLLQVGKFWCTGTRYGHWGSRLCCALHCTKEREELHPQSGTHWKGRQTRYCCHLSTG